MADCATMPSCTHLQLQQVQHKSTLFAARNAYIRMFGRDQFSGKRNFLHPFPSPEAHMIGVPICTPMKGRLCLKKNSLWCYCVGSLMNPENLVQLDWVPVADQVLLMASIIFAYMAGIVPYKRNFPCFKNETVDQESVSANSMFYGRSVKSGTCTGSNDSWGEVELKLADALTATERDGYLDGRAVECENHNKKHPFCLFAISEAPRLRLLWATFQHLQKEVKGISQTCEVVSQDRWLIIMTKVIEGSIQPVFKKWLEEELTFEIEEPERLIARISAKLNNEGTILQDINRLGKAELYADLFFFLRFGSLRRGCCYDSKLFTQHAVDVLEDLVIMLADGITSIYLELISVDSSMSGEINLGPSLCSLSTRALQRLRNEVALTHWMQQYFESVTAMYEDRFELFVFCKQQLEDLSESQTKNLSWWKKLAFRKSAAPLQLHYLQINPFSLPLRRTKELRALTGWRYYYSLFLEFSDITMPLVRTFITKVRNAVSFFLVCLIGRSLGLICSGIRQSLGWRRNVFGSGVICRLRFLLFLVTWKAIGLAPSKCCRLLFLHA